MPTPKQTDTPLKVIISPNHKVLILRGNEHYILPIEATAQFNACLRKFGATKITSTDGGQGFVVDFAEPYGEDDVQIIKAVWASLVEDAAEELAE